MFQISKEKPLAVHICLLFFFLPFFSIKKKVPEIKYLLDLNVVQQMHHTEDPLLKMWIAPEEGCHKIKGR